MGTVFFLHTAEMRACVRKHKQTHHLEPVLGVLCAAPWITSCSVDNDPFRLSFSGGREQDVGVLGFSLSWICYFMAVYAVCSRLIAVYQHKWVCFKQRWSSQLRVCPWSICHLSHSPSVFTSCCEEHGGGQAVKWREEVTKWGGGLTSEGWLTGEKDAGRCARRAARTGGCWGLCGDMGMH